MHWNVVSCLIFYVGLQRGHTKAEDHQHDLLNLHVKGERQFICIDTKQNGFINRNVTEIIKGNGRNQLNNTKKYEMNFKKLMTLRRRRRHAKQKKLETFDRRHHEHRPLIPYVVNRHSDETAAMSLMAAEDNDERKFAHHLCCKCDVDKLFNQAIDVTRITSHKPAIISDFLPRSQNNVKSLLKTKRRLTVAVLLPLPCANMNGNESLSVKISCDNTRSIWNGILEAQAYLNRHIDDDFELCLEVVDTPCRTSYGVHSLFDLMNRRPNTLAVIGPPCYDVTRTLAQGIRWWGTTQLSFNVDDVALSNRQLYPTFIRTVPSLHTQFMAMAALLIHYNWLNVDVVHTIEPKYLEEYNHFRSVLEDFNIQVGVACAVDGENSCLQANNTRNNIKVFVGSNMGAKKVFCKICQSTFPAYNTVWILIGEFGDNWWNQSIQSNCSAEQLASAMSGHILVGVQGQVYSKKKGFMRSDNYQFNVRGIDITNTFLSAYAHDSLLSVVMALNKTIQRNSSHKCKYTSNTTDPDTLFRECFFRSFDDVSFNGMTGNVSFRDGERVADVDFYQMSDGGYAPVGCYVMMTSRLLMSEDDITWPGNNGPPVASAITSLKIKHLSPYTIWCVAALSLLGIFLAFAFLVFNISNKRKRVIKMSSPNLNNVIVAGCILGYFTLILIGIEGHYVSHSAYDTLCKLKQWLPTCAFTLAFGTMFLKTWRVHAIFTNIAVKRKVIKDYKLFSLLAVFLSIDVAILVTWFAVDPMRRAVENTSSEISVENGRYIMIIQNEFCKSNYILVWMVIICAYKGILMVFGLFLAWETRQVAHSTLNDSKYIGASVYVTVITCVVGPITSFALKDYHDLSYVITSISILICTTATLCLVFVPKVTSLRNSKANADEIMQIRLKAISKKRSDIKPVRNILSMTIRGTRGCPHGAVREQKLNESPIRGESVDIKQCLYTEKKRLEQILQQHKTAVTVLSDASSSREEIDHHNSVFDNVG